MNGNSYQNASMGMRHLFTSEILQIISAILLFITAVLGITGGVGKAFVSSEEPVFSGLLIAALVFGLLWTIFSLVSLILKIVGLAKAGKDHIYFKYAFGLVFVGMLLTVGTAVFGRNPVVSGILGTAAECVEVIMMIMVVYGCISLLNEKGNLAMVISGYSVVNLMVLVNMISVISRILPVFIVSNTLDIVFYGFYTLLSIVSGIMYIVFLKRASKALA